MFRQLISETRHNRRLAWLFLALIISNYSVQLIPELNDTETYPDYYDNILPKYITCVPFNISLDEPITNRNFLKYWLNCLSYIQFGNDRVLPILFSISIAYLVYFIGHRMTNDRIIGLIACQVFTLDPLVAMFDSSPTYDQAWAFFFLLSVALLYTRASILSLVVYPLSVMSKSMALWFLPVLLYQIAIEQVKHKKIILLFAPGIILVSFLVVLSLGIGSQVHFNPERIVDGFTRIFSNIWPVIPQLVGFIGIATMFRPKQKAKAERLICIWMFWLLVMTPLVYLFSDQGQYGYRFVPFLAFMAIFFAITTINLGNFIIESRLKSQGKPRTSVKSAIIDSYKFWSKKPTPKT